MNAIATTVLLGAFLHQEVTLDEVLTAAQRAHDEVSAYRVAGTTVAERLGDDDTWQLEGRWVVDALVDTSASHRFHCTFDELVLRWVDGPSGYATDSLVVAFDGRIGSVYRTRTGSIDKPREISRGSIQVEPPSSFNGHGRMITGSDSTLWGWNARGQNVLTHLVQSRDEFTVRDGTFHALPCVVLERRSPHKPVLTWYLDPERAYSCVGHSMDAGHGGFREEVRVLSLAQVSEHAFLPTNVLRESRSQGQLIRKIRFEAEQVSAVQNVTPGDFRVTWPAGTSVYDPLADATLHVAPPDEQLADSIRDLVGQARIALAAGPAPELHLATSEHPTHPGDSTGADQPRPATTIALVVLGVLAGALLLSRAIRRRARVAALLIALAVTTSAADAQILSAGIRELEEVQVLNCGWNVTAFLLEYHDCRVVPADLDQSLELDSQRNRVLSLLEIKNSLLSRGLTVEAFKDASLKESAAMVDEDHLVVLHVRRAEHRPAHFLILAGTTDDALYFVDPPMTAAWMTRRDAEDAFGRTATGFCLRVSGPTPAPSVAGVPLLSSGRVVHDLGVVAEKSRDFTVSVPVHNDSDETLSVRGGRGSCNCYRGVESVTLQPRATTNLLIEFSGHNFGSGKVRRVVRVLLDGGRELRVDVLADVRRSKRPRTLEWLPSRLTTSPERSTDRIVFVTPGGATLRPDPAAGVELELAAPPILLAENNPREVREYLVRWIDPDKRPTELVFRSDCSDHPKITIPIVEPHTRERSNQYMKESP